MTRLLVWLCILPGLLLLADVCSPGGSFNCDGCNNGTGCCQLSHNYTVCVNVSVDGNGTLLRCRHNFTNVNVTFTWFKDKTEIIGQKKDTLPLNKEKDGQYMCNVDSSCGNCTSAPFVQASKKPDLMIVLVICAISALVLVTAMGLIMKCKLKRENAKYKERMMQRVQAGQREVPLPMTSRST
ncbi:unnamed protein product [Menidia menidia]|uniref:(Atlantic silverside) hypothetical protein n=1 Tax=Menidia menidia TaxID=238744 RepID=A0A8S4BIV6_9TELE|nr:unnamed protein product [Menidia menidia]